MGSQTYSVRSQVFDDGNPRTPASERYKFVSTSKAPLVLYVSPDGVHFTEKGVIAGAWRTAGDTQPSLMWDAQSSSYLLFGRIDDRDGSYSATRNCKGTLNGRRINTSAVRKVGFSQTAELSMAPSTDPYVTHSPTCLYSYGQLHYPTQLCVLLQMAPWDTAVEQSDVGPRPTASLWR